MRRNNFSEVVTAPARLYDRDGTMLQNDAANEAIVDRSDAQALIKRIKKFSKAEAVEVRIFGGNVTNVRFADNQMSTAGGVSDFAGRRAELLRRQSRHRHLQRGDRRGAQGDGREVGEAPRGLRLTTPSRCRSSAAAVPAGGGLLPLGHQHERRGAAKIALTALEPCRAAGDLTAAGYLENRTAFNAYGTSTGLFAYHRGTSSNYTITARTEDGTGSGWAGASITTRVWWTTRG
ncbi:MAG: hypothetical protein IPK33_25790 [Gemmatimonadetes bacterium]|nr:hypothetical protein [Gemmatimonadota bacterium]